MSRETDRHEHLLAAARALTLYLGYVEEDNDDVLVQLGEYDEEAAQDSLQALFDEDSELIADFEDLDEAIHYIELVINGATEQDDDDY